MFVSFLKFNTEKVTCLRKLIANCYGVLSPCLLNRVNVMWLFTIWSNYLKANIIWNLCPVIGYQSLQWLFSFSWKTTSAVVRALPPPKWQAEQQNDPLLGWNTESELNWLIVELFVLLCVSFGWEASLRVWDEKGCSVRVSLEGEDWNLVPEV